MIPIPKKYVKLVMYNILRLIFKVNLGIGAYRDDNGKPWVLPAVKKASYTYNTFTRTFT